MTSRAASSLARAVSQAFARANLTFEEMHPEDIQFKNLDWAAPPLLTHHKLSGALLQDMLDAPLKLDQNEMYDTWGRTLHDLWHQPSTTIRHGHYRTLAIPMRTVNKGLRQLRFALPLGYGDTRIDLRAGVMFSMEMAHLFHTSFATLDYVVGVNDYYVVLRDGRRVGVARGRPIIDSPWEYDASGMVYEMAETPRGPVRRECMYDQLAVLRSVLHTHKEKFRQDFYGCDIAMQALRCLSVGSTLPDLVTSMRVAPIDTVREKERERILWNALNVMESNNHDRSKLRTLEMLLIPKILSPSKFRTLIYYSEDYPFTLKLEKAEKIRDNLYNLYQTVPENLRRTRSED